MTYDLVQVLFGRALGNQKIEYTSSGICGCSDEDLSLNLLQLVQALTHEPYMAYDLVQFLFGLTLGNQNNKHTSFAWSDEELSLYLLHLVYT